jgi:hypothetical protein
VLHGTLRVGNQITHPPDETRVWLHHSRPCGAQFLPLHRPASISTSTAFHPLNSHDGTHVRLVVMRLAHVWATMVLQVRMLPCCKQTLLAAPGCCGMRCRWVESTVSGKDGAWPGTYDVRWERS